MCVCVCVHPSIFNIINVHSILTITIRFWHSQATGQRNPYLVIKKTTHNRTTHSICRNRNRRPMWDKCLRRKSGSLGRKVRHGPIHRHSHDGHHKYVSFITLITYSRNVYRLSMRLLLWNLISLQGNCIWKSACGKYLHLKKSNLHELNEVERKSLQQIALNRINQLNIGVPVKLPSGDILKEIYALLLRLFEFILYVS